MKELLLVAAGGALGAAARWGLGGWVAERLGPGFPWHTAVVNVSGALLIGLLMGVTMGRASVSPDWRAFLGTGVLGGYTTFSTLAYETVRLIEQGFWGQATLNMFGSGALGIVAALVGLTLGRLV
ncbi:MAG: fluoride efflux transporter CrcB [Coriobacteriia bacterium]|nr:fluoride efflux transporter CrcB [Coriobacteriia bacterium]